MNEDPRNIDIADFDYPLPEDRIAKHPLTCRDACKLLVRYNDGTLADHTFADLPSLLTPDSILIVNNTKVIRARLHFKKAQGAKIEIFCLEPHTPVDYQQSFASTASCSWTCLVGNSKRWKTGTLSTTLTLPEGSVTLCAERTDEQTRQGSSVIRFSWQSSNNATVTFSQIIEAAGEIPIPPYLNRASEDTDITDYQTVYSRIEGSVAAPTAGLHFTPQLFDRLKNAGITTRELTLHVGAGTFAPVKTETIGGHPMHSEYISVPLSLIEELATTQSKIIAIGTTSVRTLESLYHLGCKAATNQGIDSIEQWYPYSNTHPQLDAKHALTALTNALRAQGLNTLVAETRIIIAPGYTFKIVDSIVTNFHQPKSTLLLLVSAFTGGQWRQMYAHALDSGYRFLSYGDAQLLL